ncbi:tyrosine-type recombinase/integrase [Sphingomonas sp. MG17]|uniref:Tyrosine-type recombinase/integrase n=1 Tax=Sphingomonas tagetis TaxID=2949092 RepID=A0A9X2KNV3_9SPHN|nr:tyrosine-type recombinase/integrase [Sphingomonas tagetis]MCP3733240.1 tyrosine-type recombinase/integrase [Sphingomonas tagetis]
MTPLRAALDRYVNMQRGFGYKFTSAEHLLIDFVAFMDAQGEAIITNKLAIDWATGAAGPASWPSRLGTVRSFARHLSCTEPRTDIPPAGIVRSTPRPAPYIYTELEIAGLLDAMRALTPATRLRRWTYHYLFGLLAVTGLRVGEALRLKRDDVDLDTGILTIRETKFGKSRIVPISPSTVAALNDYVTRRNARRCRSAGLHFFTGEHGGQLYHQNIHLVFCAVSRQLGLRPGSGGGPRIHDLRHSFAVNMLLRWYRAGEDVEQLLPVLSTYLGHSHTRDTYWYLSACPELMEHAVHRLETRWEGVS